MELEKLTKLGSWDDRAEEYRVYADEASDELARLGYLQRAQYCDAMAAREQRQHMPSAA